MLAPDHVGNPPRFLYIVGMLERRVGLEERQQGLEDLPVRSHNTTFSEFGNKPVKSYWGEKHILVRNAGALRDSHVVR